MDIDRVIVIVLDGVGAGEAPDANLYGDVGSNSLSNTSKAVGGLSLPNMGEIGIGYITGILGVPPHKHPNGCYGKLQPKSAGKDTISGHWELMGIHLPKPLPTFPNGFPESILAEFKKRTGKDVIGNKAASGTEIIQELAIEHIRTGKPILYTSADSVFQLAAHEKIIPIDELYHLCSTARDMLNEEGIAVGRVIARPFLGDTPGNFIRTVRRKDYPLLPDSDTILDKLVSKGYDVFSVGKIDDIFGHRGITKSNHTSSNHDTILAMLDFIDINFKGLLFANLIEFDMIWGHRNDPKGYAGALEEFDSYIPEIRKHLKYSDIVMIVADHGVDPTTLSTDHSREYVPLLVFGPQIQEGVNLGIRKTFSDVAATIAELFSLLPPKFGESFLSSIKK